MNDVSYQPDGPSAPVVEGIISTEGEDGSVHFAAMGPRVDSSNTNSLLLRPFEGSRTLANLQRSGYGVFHLTDRALQLARIVTKSELGCLQWQTFGDHYYVMNDACSWHGFTVETIDESELRARVHCRITESGILRPWGGWNRAQHAVVELAILYSRVGILPADEITRQMQHVESWVTKTGGAEERHAWKLLQDAIRVRLANEAQSDQ